MLDFAAHGAITTDKAQIWNFSQFIPLQRMARLSPRASAVPELMFSTRRCFTFFNTAFEEINTKAMSWIKYLSTTHNACSSSRPTKQNIAEVLHLGSSECFGFRHPESLSVGHTKWSFRQCFRKASLPWIRSLLYTEYDTYQYLRSFLALDQPEVCCSGLSLPPRIAKR